MGADLAGRFIAVHLRHAAIHEDEVGLQAPPGLDRLAAVLHRLNSHSELQQHLDDDFAIDDVVIGDENPPARKIKVGERSSRARRLAGAGHAPAGGQRRQKIVKLPMAEGKNQNAIGNACHHRRIASGVAAPAD